MHWQASVQPDDAAGSGRTRPERSGRYPFRGIRARSQRGTGPAHPIPASRTQGLRRAGRQRPGHRGRPPGRRVDPRPERSLRSRRREEASRRRHSVRARRRRPGSGCGRPRCRRGVPVAPGRTAGNAASRNGAGCRRLRSSHGCRRPRPATPPRSWVYPLPQQRAGECPPIRQSCSHRSRPGEERRWWPDPCDAPPCEAESRARGCGGVSRPLPLPGGWQQGMGPRGRRPGAEESIPCCPERRDPHPTRAAWRGTAGAPRDRGCATRPRRGGAKCVPADCGRSRPLPLPGGSPRPRGWIPIVFSAW